MKNKKGFTLIELLAVVVILGIILTVSIPAVSRWINRGKAESLESQRRTILMAAKSYAQQKDNVLPKAIGETKIISVQELKNNNYLKEDIVNSEKKSCMQDSYARIYKYAQNGYSYTAYIICEGDDVVSEEAGINPLINITFSGDKDASGNIKNVSTSSVYITIDGNTDPDGNKLGVDGYSYTISVRYDRTGELVEIYHSGSLNGGGKDKIVIDKDLGDYTDITKATEFVVTVEAYNRDGGHLRHSASSLYDDQKKPTCGVVTGEPAVDSWNNTPSVRTISVKCIDEEDGSGCVRDEYTKSFDTEMEFGTITISDNAGNTTDCQVRVNNDWTRPALTITVYKRTSSGGKGDQVARAVSNNTNPEVTISDFTDSYGSDHWLNYANFPYGLYVEVATDDNIHLNIGEWYYNPTGIGDFNASNLMTMTKGDTKTFTATDRTTYKTLSGEGIRRARYVLSDKAGHTATVHIQANIDRTNPGCTSSGGSSSWQHSLTIKGTCSDNISKCKNATITKQYTADISSTKESPGTVYDNANNSTKCPGNQTVKIDNTAPSCSGSKIVVESPDGVTVSLRCSDNLSGVASCPCHVSEEGGNCIASTGLKASKYYSVTDRAGNSSGCSVTVTEYDAYSERTRDCRTYNTCQTSACGTTCCHESYECGSYSCSGSPGDDDPTSCFWAGGYWSYTPKTCYKAYCNCTCASPSCGCKTFTAWSAWSGYSFTSCSNSDYVQCRSRKQYK